MLLLRRINIKGDLFATVACYVAGGAIRLGSSVVITRVLNPEAYGIITIMLSVPFFIQQIGDFNTTLFIVRDKEGEDPRFLNTAFTLGLARSVLNAAIMFLLAPFIASSIYKLDSVTLPLQVFSISFVISGLQSMSFALAVRRKQARVMMYAELCASFLSTCFSVLYCYRYHSYWGIVYGILLQRLTMTSVSHFIYPQVNKKLAIDWSAARKVMQYSKFVMPSSLLTLGLTQMDKIFFVRFFDLRLLGIYGLGGNIAGNVDSLVAKISQSVLYPRCAHNFRENFADHGRLYYTENIKLFMSLMVLPAIVGGSAQFVINVLYPEKYSSAGIVLQAFMLRSALLSLALPAEDLLIATGEFQVILNGNIFLACSMLLACLLGTYMFGFVGFVFGVAISAAAPLIYYFWLQNKKNLFVARYEAYRVLYILFLAGTSHVFSVLVMHWFPHLHLRHSSV